MLIDICMKFRKDSFRGFQVTERTRFVTDRRTDRRPGKNNMSPNLSGGDIISFLNMDRDDSDQIGWIPTLI